MFNNHAASRAHRAEMRHSRKEDRLHDKAVNAAAHGNFAKASRLENRANNQHMRAEAAHRREVTSRIGGVTAAIAGAMIGHHHHTPNPNVTVVHQHVYEPNGGYPTGMVPPPSATHLPTQPPSAGSYPGVPLPAYPGVAPQYHPAGSTPQYPPAGAAPQYPPAGAVPQYPPAGSVSMYPAASGYPAPPAGSYTPYP